LPRIRNRDRLDRRCRRSAVVGSFLAGLDNPLPTFRNFYAVFLGVIAVNGVYQFGVLPRITTLEMLIVALAPTFLLCGWMAARRRPRAWAPSWPSTSRCNWR
jgi:hypothetical protein